MDGSTKCYVTNIVEILRNNTWFNQHNRLPICMCGDTLGKIIVPMSKGWLQVQAGTRDGFIDVLCYYSPHFTLT